MMLIWPTMPSSCQDSGATRDGSTKETSNKNIVMIFFVDSKGWLNSYLEVWTEIGVFFWNSVSTQSQICQSVCCQSVDFVRFLNSRINRLTDWKFCVPAGTVNLSIFRSDFYNFWKQFRHFYFQLLHHSPGQRWQYFFTFKFTWFFVFHFILNTKDAL